MSEFLIPALKIVCTFQGLAVIFLGALFGILCGAMPGLSAIMAMTILMPFTFSLDGLYGSAGGFALMVPVSETGKYRANFRDDQQRL